MYKNLLLVLLVLAGITAVGCRGGQEEILANETGAKERIGVYDSRAIAVAFVGSKAFEENMKKLRETFEEAKRQGDKALMAKCEEEGESQQARLHRQGFSTAPVDNIMVNIEDQMPKIMREAGVSKIVSKWDEKALSENQGSEQVDVTAALIQEFHPTERQLKHAQGIQTKDPIPLDKLDKMLENEEH